MGNKFLNLAALLILIIVVGLVVFNAVRKEAKDLKPMVMSPSELERRESGTLSEEDFVIVTMTDSRYHRKGCSYISGPTEKMIYKVAVESGAQPCPYCIGEE